VPDSVLVELTDLLRRWTELVKAGPRPSWTTTRDILRNDIWEFSAKWFDQDSSDRGTIASALNPRSISIYGTEWDNFNDDYGEQVFSALNVVKHRLEKGQSKLKPDMAGEILIEADSPHSAYVALRELVEKSAKRLLIVDPWVDRTLFALLSNISASVDIRILTRQQYLPRDFATEAAKFKQQHGSSLEVRDGTDIHDRFLIVDDRLFFSGASFKDLGKKKSVVAEIFDIKRETETTLETSWKSATVLVGR